MVPPLDISSVTDVTEKTVKPLRVKFSCVFNAFTHIICFFIFLYKVAVTWVTP